MSALCDNSVHSAETSTGYPARADEPRVATPALMRFERDTGVRMRVVMRSLLASPDSCWRPAAAARAKGSTPTAGRRGRGADTPLAPTLASLQQNVFTPACTGCHAGRQRTAGLRLDAANSYAMLVGVPSVEVPGLLRVAPGNPGASYLVQKLEGNAAVGARMPLGGPFLDAATIAVVRQWIAAGAPRGPAQP